MRRTGGTIGGCTQSHCPTTPGSASRKWGISSSCSLGSGSQPLKFRGSGSPPAGRSSLASRSPLRACCLSLRRTRVASARCGPAEPHTERIALVRTSASAETGLGTPGQSKASPGLGLADSLSKSGRDHPEPARVGRGLINPRSGRERTSGHAAVALARSCRWPRWPAWDCRIEYVTARAAAHARRRVEDGQRDRPYEALAR